MRRTGIVDLGSNTARMVVYGYKPGRWYRLLDEIRENVRLGEGMGRGPRLEPAAIERAAAALKLYADFAAALGLEPPRVIATSALRDAENAELFWQRVSPLGLEIEVLGGEREAELGVLAVANSFALDDAWVMDLGGGSAQVSEMRQRRYRGGTAHPLGAVRLSEAWLAGDPPRPSEVQALEAAVEAELGTIAGELRRSPLPLVAMGGTIRNLARAVQKAGGYPLGLLHGYFLARKDLEGITERLLATPVAARRKVSGIHPDRADVIVAGALVYRWLLRRAERDGLWISGYGVREGAFLERFLPAPHLGTDVRRFSVENLFRCYPQPAGHTADVKRLARLLFDGLMPLHGLGPEARELLDAAAVLHDVGMAVGYHNHHKHGAYLVETSRMLNGFSHREVALLTLLVRYHRKGAPRWPPRWSEGQKRLTAPGDKKLLLYLTVCLRLAEYLERARAGRVENVEVWIAKDEVVVELSAREEPAVEIWEARKHAPLFEQAFSRRLVLRRRPTAPGAPSL